MKSLKERRGRDITNGSKQAKLKIFNSYLTEKREQSERIEFRRPENLG